MRKNRQSVFLLISGFCWLAWLTTAATAAPLYSVTDLGTLGGTSSAAYGINNNGQIVGYTYMSGDAAYHATLWNGGTMTDLGTLGGINSAAYGINDSGQIVGQMTDIYRQQHGFLLSGGSYLFDVSFIGVSGSTSVNGINNLGQFVGSIVLYSSSGTSVGFYYGNGAYTELYPQGYWTSPQGINDSGQIVGSYMDTSGSHGFVNSGGGFTTLDDPLAGGFGANGINDNGQVVGWSGLDATLWIDGSAIDLNSLLDPSGLGWSLSSANGINDLGQIVGVGTNPAGETHAFLLTPDTDPVAVPVPATLALFASGIGGLGFLQWRRRRNQRLAKSRPRLFRIASMLD
jgi:probable HAF family extracellular repeat protein